MPRGMLHLNWDLSPFQVYQSLADFLAPLGSKDMR